MYHAMTKQFSAQVSFVNVAPHLTSPPAGVQHRNAVDGTSTERTEPLGLNAITRRHLDHLGLAPIAGLQTQFTVPENRVLASASQDEIGNDLVTSRSTHLVRVSTSDCPFRADDRGSSHVLRRKLLSGAEKQAQLWIFASSGG